MSRDSPLLAGSSLEKICQLEDQVKGLMETVNLLYKAYHLDNLNIPRPDQYVRAGGYTVGDMQDRIPRTQPAPAGLQPAPAGAATAKSKSASRSERTGISASGVSSLAPYKYSPLSAESSEIRLLALETSTSLTDPITCRLVTASLDNVPKHNDPLNSSPIQRFTPLSYCWGTSSMTKRIVIDRHSFLVTPSLYGALLHFRKDNYNPKDPFKRRKDNNETYWWIDAICINQNDLDERNSQVGLMTRLYKQAQMVHIWLGEEGDDSAQAMQVIRELAYRPTSLEECESWGYIPKPGQTHRPDGPGQPMVKLPTDGAPISGEEKLKNYTALINLYQRPWFSRVWIRQEVALPGDVKFHCGTETCTWDEIMRTADILTYLADEYHLPALQQEGIRRNGSFASCFHKAMELNEIREEMNIGIKNYAKLQSLVLRSRDCQATDPRDKVYAMLPLTNPDKTDIMADYRKDYREVYKAVALSLITSRLDYLCGCQNPSPSNGLPSWVPNLEVPRNPLTASGFCHDKTLYNHWGNPPDDSPQFTYVPEHSRLDIQGVIFDEVRAINHESYLSADASNADVRTITARWREFYASQRDELFESWSKVDEMDYWNKRDQCMNMFDSVLDQEVWESRVLQNINGDMYRPGNGGEGIRFKLWGDTVDYDPTLKRVKRLLPSDPTPYSEKIGKKDEYFAALRPLAVGRRLMITSKGAMGLIPADAKSGDEICFFDGSGSPFVIRKVGDDTWVIVGQAYYFGRIVLNQAKTKLTKTTIRLV